jgi:hypothetical protein
MSAGVSRIATVSFDLEEFRLIAAARTGDKLAYGQLVARNQAAVFHAAYLLTGSATQAQTVTVQTFVQAWSSLGRLPVTVALGTWLESIAAQEAGRMQCARRAASPGIEPPADRDLTADVLARLGRRKPAPCVPGGRRAFAFAALVAALAAGAVIALAPWGLHTVGPRPAGAALGERISLTRARNAAGFTALMPPSPGAAYLRGNVTGDRLSVVAGHVLITEFRGAAFPYILTLIGPGAHAELTWVNGRAGFYGGSTPLRPGRDVLTWLQGPLTLRIEGARTLEHALALARTLR